jgi:transposase-like protein
VSCPVSWRRSWSVRALGRVGIKGQGAESMPASSQTPTPRRESASARRRLGESSKFSRRFADAVRHSPRR